ncbi:Isochorismatase family protein [Marinomonas sp. MED121]|uniref:cysteine hydrolase family protein n=1 Tax=Marinomonas sp. MED121 TaxID=314277 RepID=UPI000069115D|nr:cysteine hydrolase family protein [Marinomonas sp. MED121]EAQ67201.1 Isochorismatase family protein [Marinomonas sp. MED121]
MKALLIIDMQKSLFKTPRHDFNGVVSRINTLADELRKAGGLVIYIQHNGAKEDDLLEGSQGWEIIDELDKSETDFRLTKTACDAFYQTELEALLKSKGITEVVITGAATEFCVDTSLRACLSKGFNVTAISDGHTTANREHLSAEQIIKHHNWSWENLIIPNVDIKIVTASEAIETRKF